jgi:hypothetical protein
MENQVQNPKFKAANAREQARRKSEMERENKRTLRGENVEEIVAKTAEILSGGKTFGGWTDKTMKEDRSHTLKPSPDQLRKATTNKKPKPDTLSNELRRLSDPSDPSTEPLVKIGPDSSRKNPKYTRNINAGVEHDFESLRNELKNNHEMFGILPEDVDTINDLTEEELLELAPLLGMAARWAVKKGVGALAKRFVRSKVAGAVGKVAAHVGSAMGNQEG